MNGHGRSTDGFGIDRDASVMLIVDTALEHGVDDPRKIAYMLATAQHETRDFAAPEEDFGRSQARKLGYSGGEEFYGRGYVHLTHDYNYRKFDELLGLDGELVKNPDRAKDPEIAAKILVVGMRDGLFTGRRLDRYINEETHDAYNARRVVNGITGQAWTIKAAEDCQHYAKAWEVAVPALIEESRARTAGTPPSWQSDLQQVLDRVAQPNSPRALVLHDGLPNYLRLRPAPAQLAPIRDELRQGARGEQVRTLQSALDQLGIRDGQGRPLVPDGVFGPATRQAVENFQLWNGLETSGITDRETHHMLREPASRLAVEALDHAATPASTQAPLDPRDAAHPDHAMYLRIRSGVSAIDESNGKPYDGASERISRCLLARCRGADAERDTNAPNRGGVVLQRVDHVVMGSTGTLFAIQGRLDDPARRRIGIPVADAGLVPAEESDRRLAAVNAQANWESSIDQQQGVALPLPLASHAGPNGMTLQG